MSALERDDARTFMEAHVRYYLDGCAVIPVETLRAVLERYFEPRQSEADELFGHPARYWYDAFQIAEGLRADAERRVDENKRDAARYRWLRERAVPQYTMLARMGDTASLYQEKEIHCRAGSWAELSTSIDAAMSSAPDSAPLERTKE